jgi:hypothetical protein
MTEESPRAEDRPDDHPPIAQSPTPAEPVGEESTTVDRTVREERPSLRGVRTWFWAVLVVTFAVFVLFGSVPTHSYLRNTSNRVVPRIRDVSLREIWQLQADNLPDFGGNLLPTVVYYGAILLFVLGSAAVVWFALAPNPAWVDRPTPRPAPIPGTDPPGGGATAPSA